MNKATASTVAQSIKSTKQLSPPQGLAPANSRKPPIKSSCSGLGLDAAQAHLMLDLIGLDEREVHIRAIPHKGKAGGAINGNFANDLERFQDLNNQGYGLYLQPNIGGTKAKDITLATTLFYEYDDRPRTEQVRLWESTVGLQPTFQVDTRGKSIHNYLVLETPIDPKPWTLLMERLQLAAPGCDRACKGKNRLMRMAGSHYITATVNPKARCRSLTPTGRVIQLNSWMQSCLSCHHRSPAGGFPGRPAQRLETSARSKKRWIASPGVLKGLVSTPTTATSSGV